MRKRIKLENYYECCEEYYTDALGSMDLIRYEKYIDFLTGNKGDGKVLDMGCGVGQVVNALCEQGYDAYGVDISPVAIKIAGKINRETFVKMNGTRIPFGDNYFDSVGSFTVLEHIKNPQKFLDEQIRVLKPGGKIVIASPNFLRVVGISAHHWRTRGLKNKIINLSKLVKKSLQEMKLENLEWEFMEPTLDLNPGADHDAVCITNPIDIKNHLKRRGLKVKYHSSLLNCHKYSLINLISELLLMRSLTGGVFIVAEKER